MSSSYDWLIDMGRRLPEFASFEAQHLIARVWNSHFCGGTSNITPKAAHGFWVIDKMA
jgi:hypothetical protein